MSLCHLSRLTHHCLLRLPLCRLSMLALCIISRSASCPFRGVDFSYLPRGPPVASQRDFLVPPLQVDIMSPLQVNLCCLPRSTSCLFSVPHFQVTSALWVDFVPPLEVAVVPPIVMCLLSRSRFFCRPVGSFSSSLGQHHATSRGRHYAASSHTWTSLMAHDVARTLWLLIHIQPQKSTYDAQYTHLLDLQCPTSRIPRYD